jgi:predicted N-acetyltransferase YhbS
MEIISAPEPITIAHILEGFDCGVPVLSEWLVRQSLVNEHSRASRTFVFASDMRVAGYYSLATGSILRHEAPGKIRRKMPEPIPVMVLARLAVGLPWQNKGLGSGLLQDALLRTLAVADHAGIRALIVHALSAEAKGFYLRFGFVVSPLNDMTLMLGLEGLRT